MTTRQLLTLSTLWLTLGATALLAQGPTHEASHTVPSNYDARIEHNLAFRQAPGLEQRRSVDALRHEIPGLDIRYARTTGATRSVYNRAGYLSDAHPDADPTTLALDYLRGSRQLLGLSESDLAGAEIIDQVPSLSGSTHFYLRQTYRGLPVYGSQLQVHINREGRVLSVNSSFLPGLATHAPPLRARVGARQALRRAADHLGFEAAPRILHREEADPQRTTFLQLSEQRPELAEAQLVWLSIRAAEVRLAWNLQIPAEDGDHSFDMTIDAETGKVWTRFDSRDAAEYRVYEAPIESPLFTSPLPTADARSLAVNPHDTTASPLGWHDDGTTSYTTTQGNNIKAFTNGSTPTDCGSSLSCDFSLDLDTDPSNSRDAAVANAFYWTNYIHDVHYQYGFDEAAGNFQQNNFGNGGSGGDPVDVKVQYSTLCNASFSRAVDGSKPSIKLHLCNNDTPKRDGAYDNGVIVHEYGHGITHRLVGGPSTVSCLDNTQRPSEGWSDWFGMVYTATPGDAGTDLVGRGTWLYALPTDGTNRPLPYSTDPTINTYTYASIGSGISIPHGTGSVWAQALWEVYWALVDTYGFEGDLANFDLGDPDEAGNKRALFYVTQGLKHTACSPSFIDARTGIIQAAIDNFGGADVCMIWEAFANFGLGHDATTTGGSSTTATDGFAMPPECPTVFTSVASEDGWLRESGEETGVAGAMSATGTFKAAIRAGDNVNNRQYKSIVSFDTSAIADGALIQSATLRLRRGKIEGEGPFNGGFGLLWASIRKGGFSGSTALELDDFHKPAHDLAAILSVPAADLDWSEDELKTGSLEFIDDQGTTQFKIFLSNGDDDDGIADYVGFYSGDNSDPANHPQLVISYLP